MTDSLGVVLGVQPMERGQIVGSEVIARPDRVFVCCLSMSRDKARLKVDWWHRERGLRAVLLPATSDVLADDQRAGCASRAPSVRGPPAAGSSWRNPPVALRLSAGFSMPTKVLYNRLHRVLNIPQYLFCPIPCQRWETPQRQSCEKHTPTSQL